MSYSVDLNKVKVSAQIHKVVTAKLYAALDPSALLTVNLASLSEPLLPTEVHSYRDLVAFSSKRQKGIIVDILEPSNNNKKSVAERYAYWLNVAIAALENQDLETAFDIYSALNHKHVSCLQEKAIILNTEDKAKQAQLNTLFNSPDKLQAYKEKYKQAKSPIIDQYMSLAVQAFVFLESNYSLDGSISLKEYLESKNYFKLKKLSKITLDQVFPAVGSLEGPLFDKNIIKQFKALENDILYMIQSAQDIVQQDDRYNESDISLLSETAPRYNEDKIEKWSTELSENKGILPHINKDNLYRNTQITRLESLVVKLICDHIRDNPTPKLSRLKLKSHINTLNKLYLERSPEYYLQGKEALLNTIRQKVTETLLEKHHLDKGEGLDLQDLNKQLNTLFKNIASPSLNLNTFERIVNAPNMIDEISAHVKIKLNQVMVILPGLPQKLSIWIKQSVVSKQMLKPIQLSKQDFESHQMTNQLSMSEDKKHSSRKPKDTRVKEKVKEDKNKKQHSNTLKNHM